MIGWLGGEGRGQDSAGGRGWGGPAGRGVML